MVSEQKKTCGRNGCTFKKVVTWIDRGIETFSKVYELVSSGIIEIWNTVSLEKSFTTVETFGIIWGLFSNPVKMAGSFIIDAGIEILKIIKVALLAKISELQKRAWI
jgi:hypothetical protein